MSRHLTMRILTKAEERIWQESPKPRNKITGANDLRAGSEEKEKGEKRKMPGHKDKGDSDT